MKLMITKGAKFFWLLFFVFFSSCTQNSSSNIDPQKTKLIKRGKAIYLTHCTSCHALNPSQDGPVGPAISGSSKKLLEERVLKGNYPPGYQPKRLTKIMKPMPHLSQDIEALEAYLAQ